MIKRILALALCLVMLGSLLPVTALGYEHDEAMKWLRGVADGGTYCGDTYLWFECPEGQKINSITYYNFGWDGGTVYPDADGRFKLDAGLGKIIVLFRGEYGDATEQNVSITVNADHTNENGDHFCDVCGESLHDWRFTLTENSLTATCGNTGCPIGTVGVTLSAHSVILPDSPFNAGVEVTGAFKEAFPGVEISDIRYDYQDSDGEWHQDIDPIPANAKAGQYQAGVSVSGIPDFFGDQGAASRAMPTNNEIVPGGGSVFLFLKYTAADPAVTAQTGDSRPIELMMAGAAVFSILAAVAFLLDSKRRYSN